ncbi:MAG TPA: glycosyltransferase family 87 protein [Polyangia bacterium]|nr:glycosyltransferase family 87 protein [Polyangia bacterium]
MSGRILVTEGSRSRRLIIGALLGGALASMVGFGIVGVGRAGQLGFDGRVLFAAGRAWLDGANPYDHAQLSRAVAAMPGMDLFQVEFLYPPQSSALCLLLALFSYPAARVIWLMLNLTSIAAIAWGSVSLLDAESRDGKPGAAGGDRWSRWVLLAVVIGAPFTTHVLWMGQTSLVAFAATMGAWIWARRKHWLGAGLCLGLASFKPQLSVLIAFWFMLDRDWRTLLVAAGTALVLALFPIVSRGPIGAFSAWVTGVRSGYDLVFNLPGAPHKVGLESVMTLLGLSLPSATFSVLALVSTVILWLCRARLDRTDLFALLMAFTFLFSHYLHDYDYVGLAPLFVSILRYGRGGETLPAIARVAPVLLFIPERLVRRVGVPVLEQWRTLLIAILAAFIINFAYQQQRGRSFAPAVNPE